VLYYELLISKRSGMARVNEGSHNFICHPHVYACRLEWAVPVFTLYPSSHFGWYSFPVPMRVRGWVCLDGLVKYWGGWPPEDGHPSQY